MHSRVCNKGNAVAKLTRKVIAEKITIDRIIYGFPHMTGDVRRRSRALSRIANIVGLHSADFLRAPTPESRNCQVRAQLDLWLAEKAISHAFLVRIPVPVILVSLLFDAPHFIEQNRIRNGELEAVAHEGVGPL